MGFKLCIKKTEEINMNQLNQKKQAALKKLKKNDKPSLEERILRLEDAIQLLLKGE